MIENLDNFWKDTFGDFPPEAHRLKHQYTSLWVRFHTLPGSKRYADTEGEYLEILRRHKLLLDELSKSSKVFFVVFAEYSEFAVPEKPSSEITNLFTKLEYWRSVTSIVEGQDDFYFHYHVSEIRYEAVEFNPLFRLIANDEVANVLIVHPGNRFVYHPYDGGVDVILESEQQRDFLKVKYRNWLSSHPDGL